MGLSAIQSISSQRSLYVQQQSKVQKSQYNEPAKKVEKASEEIATGKRVNRAKDDAAAAAIAQKILSQYAGKIVGNNNTQDMSNALKVADGGLNSITDNLQRMRELGLQASNGILSNEDKALIQEEINQIKEGIKDIVSGSEFNTKKLLDGSFQNMNTASNADGSGTEVSIGDMGLDALGIKDFDVTGNFSLDTIDRALQKVSEERSSIGAMTNRLEHTYNSNSVAIENEMSSHSKLVDANIGKSTMDYNIQNAITQYKIFAQRQMQNQMTQSINLMF